MGISLTPVRTFDFSIAYAIANDPQVFSEFTEDGAQEYMPDVVNKSWIVMYTEKEEIAGAYLVAQTQNRVIEIHAFMLPDYRKMYGRLSGKLILEWCVKNADWDKIVTSIPSTRKSVFHFTKALGFKEEGYNRLSFQKNGKLHGVYQLGATRNELVKHLELEQ